MKKLLTVIISSALIAACLSGCGNSAKSNITLNVTDENFLTLTTDIYKNSADYVGREIKIEGVCAVENYNGKNILYVYRNAAVYDSGHGHDHAQKLGFEFAYNGNLPKDNDWIEVIGSLRSYVENGNTILTLNANSVTILNNRGADTIENTEAVEHGEEDNDEHSH